MLSEELLLSLAGVQCEGGEESLLDCPRSSAAAILESYDDGGYEADFISTVVACANSTASALPLPGLQYRSLNAHTSSCHANPCKPTTPPLRDRIITACSTVWRRTNSIACGHSMAQSAPRGCLREEQIPCVRIGFKLWCSPP